MRTLRKALSIKISRSRRTTWAVIDRIQASSALTTARITNPCSVIGNGSKAWAIWSTCRSAQVKPSHAALTRRQREARRAVIGGVITGSALAWSRWIAEIIVVGARDETSPSRACKIKSRVRRSEVARSAVGCDNWARQACRWARRANQWDCLEIAGRAWSQTRTTRREVQIEMTNSWVVVARLARRQVCPTSLAWQHAADGKLNEARVLTDQVACFEGCDCGEVRRGWHRGSEASDSKGDLGSPTESSDINRICRGSS